MGNKVKNGIIYLSLILILFSYGCSEKRGKKGSGVTAPADTVVRAAPVKPAVNVYIENSASMDGYVNGFTEFKNTVFQYLSDIKVRELTDTLNLFYINSQILKHDSDIEDFIQELDPASFRKRGGNRGISDISNVIKSVLNETRKDAVSILVTDGIFSPGKGKDAAEYLINQQVGIKINMAEYLKKHPNTAVIVYQLLSKFKGVYYDKTDKYIPFEGQRPFYIWIIGDAEHVVRHRAKIPDEDFKGGKVQNIFSIVAGNLNVNYAVRYNSGKFETSRTDPKKEILNLKKDSRSKQFTFAVNVDFSGLLLDDSYLTDTGNYENGSGYELEIRQKSDKNYTHSLTFTSDRVHKGQVAIKLKSKMPDWVSMANDEEGSTPVENKTYGIKYQLEGVYEAFTINNNYYTEIKINIK